MRVLVFVKDVPSGSAPPPYRPDLRLDRAHVDGTMSGVDLFAVAEAVRLSPDVVAATMGPAGARATLREALAAGAARAVHVEDRTLAGADARRTAHVLSAVVRRERPDLVLLGRESSDARMGVMAGMLAEHLGWPALSAVDRLEVEGARLRARRRSATSIDEVETSLPAVASAAEYAATPRALDGAALRRAYLTPIETLTASDLGLAVADGEADMAVRDLALTPVSRQKRVIEDATAADLLDVLAAHGVAAPVAGVTA